MGLEHGYMEDIIVHPDYQGRGIGVSLVKALLKEAEQFGLKIITVTFAKEKINFYKVSGFKPGTSGLWQNTR